MDNPRSGAAPLRVILAGATGWAGSALARAVARQQDMTLAGAVGGSSAGRRLGEVLGDASIDALVHPTARAALSNGACDVYVEYSKPKDIATVRDNIVAALEG